MCAEAEVMTKPDSLVFPWTSVAQSAHPVFSVQLFLVVTQLLRAPELPGTSFLAPSVSPACTEELLSTVDTTETTRQPNMLVTQVVKSQTDSSVPRLELGVSGCSAQGHQL